MTLRFKLYFFSLLFLIFFSSSLKAQFSGGSGTIASPFVIANFNDLVTLSGNSAYWDKHYIQSANIDASASALLNSGAGFLPIATTSIAFTGSYDGQDYTISGLTINRPTTSSVGLFAELKGATLANMRLSAAVISGTNNVGGFVGWAGQGSQLTNLIIEADAMVTGLDDVGGIVGEAEDTGLTNCHSMATIDGNDTTGGLIGFCDLNLTAKTVLSCSFQGILTGDGDDVGGLIGQNQQRVENCFSIANVTSLDATGDDHYGVLIGLNQGAVLKSYANGTVTASGIEIGGLIGRNESSVSNCYSVVNVTGTNDIGGLIGYNTGQVTYCFALGSVRGNDDTGGLIGNHLTGATLDQCYAAVRVMNTADDEIGGLIAEREGSVTNCFWVDVFGDDNAYLGDEENSVDEQIKQVSNVPHPFVNYSLGQIQGSNAIATLTYFDFVNHWDPAPNGAPGAFPVLKDMPPPAGAPIAPTGFTSNGGNNQVNLSWSSNVESDIMSYNIYRSGSANFELSSATLLATVSHTPAGMSYTDDGAGFLPAPVNGTLYHYALTALDNDSNESLAHYGAAIPGEYTASVQLSLEIDGVTYTENHGNISPDAYAVYTNTTGGNITSYHTSIVDGSGKEQGLLHPTSATSGTLTITPVGLQPGQQWYLFYDDNTVSGYPVRNTSGEPGSGTTLVTGTGNNPITLNIGIDGIATDYLFYVDKPVFNNTAPTVLDLTDVTVNLYPQRLDVDVLVTDDEMSSNNDGVGNYSGLSLTVQRLGGANMNDVFGLSVPNENFTFQDGVIYYYGKSIGTYLITPGSIHIQLIGVEIIVTQNIVNNIVRGITYAHRTSASMPAQLTLEWTVSDGLADFSLNQEVSLGYYSGGNGTQYNPWQISTQEDLADLSQHQAHWADYFVLTSNIDASATAFFDDLDDNADGYKYNDPDDASASGTNQGFSPIGTSSIPFSGSFSGQGFAISGLSISRPANNNTGLFGFVDGATIEGLLLSSVQISGADATGALAGCSINAEFSAIQVSGNITGASMTGGLIGKAENTLVSQCIANGSVMGADDCGGLIGRFSDNNTEPVQQVSNSYATASVVGQNNVGGLIGNNQTGVVHCYSIGSVTGVTDVGGLIGLGSTGFATASFWNVETALVADNGIGIPATTDPMKSFCTYYQAGWDFVGESDNGSDNCWSINSSHHNGYPTLSWEGFTNTGTCANPFIMNISPSVGTTALEFQVLTHTGPVNYYWESSTSGKAGDGSFSSTMLGLGIIPGLSVVAGESITLYIEPTFLQQLSLYNTNTNDFDIDIQQWGDVAWSSMAYAFAECSNLSISATDSPDLSNVSSLAHMFFQATSFNDALNHWDVSNVVDFQGMFQGASAFNQPLNNWDVSSATNMSFMFALSASFNQNVALWDITGVTTMEAMFKTALAYNEPLGDWTFGTGVLLTDFLNDSGLDCINYAKTLKGWAENENTPTMLSLSAENIAYGLSAVDARTLLINDLEWIISGDTPTAGDCPLCPVLTDIPDDVVIINSVCTENCAPTGGSIAEPAIACPIGYFRQYQVNAGIWTDTLPLYLQSGPAQTIKTRCVCEEDFTSIGAESIGVTTEPGLCVFPVASISGDTIICANDSTTLSANPGLSYLWSTLETNSAITVSPDEDTNYQLIVTDTNGCMDTATTTVMVLPLPTIVCPDNVIIASSNDGLADCIGSASWIHPSENAGACGPISLTMQLDDNAAVAVVPGDEIGQPLAVGIHQIAYTLTDGGMNQASCNFEIQVIDDEAPVINCPPSADVVFNGQAIMALVPEQLAMFSDNCGLPSIVLSPDNISIVQLGQAIPVNVVAYDDAGNSAGCTTLVQVSGLPQGWRHNNGAVGNCNSEAMFNPTNSVWTASARNCVHTSPFENDNMMFAQRQLCGDGSITAQITSMGGAQGWAGIAMRETNAVGAKKIHMLINLSSNVLQQEVRTNTGAQAFPQYMSNPQNRTWLRIVRHGNQFTGYSSHDGLTWWFVLRVSIPMNTCIEIGLNLINRYPNQLTTASYANVSVTGSASPPGIVINDYAESIDMPHSIAFDIYPNPTGGIINIQLDERSVNSGNLKVYNQLGICVFQRTLDNHFEQLDMSHLPDGIYWVQYNHYHYLSELKRIILHKNR